MTRIGLTQRVDVIDSYGERRDCLDQAWTALLDDWSYQPLPLPNTVRNPGDYLDSLDLDGLVLTSGNDLAHLEDATQPAPERDEFEHAVVEWAIEQSIPILGVCRGLEFINDYFGGTLSTVEDHVATEHAVSFQSNSNEITGTEELTLPDEIQVNSYHDYGLTPEDVADDLQMLAVAPDGTVEAVTHPNYPILGIMWHPERDTPSTPVDHKLFDGLFTDID